MKRIKLLMLVFSAFLVAIKAFGQDPKRFENEVKAFEKMDAANPPKKGGTLFLGSSSIRKWKEAEEIFSRYNVINRGFGGSQTSDAIYYFDRLVLPYQPTKILFYEGDNDIGSGKTPMQVFEGFKAFVKLVREKLLPTTTIGFVAIKPSPARIDKMEDMEDANRVIKAYCNAHPDLHFIDVYTPMLNEEGKPKAEIFLDDKLHMNELGYKIWEKQVKKFLRKG